MKSLCLGALALAVGLATASCSANLPTTRLSSSTSKRNASSAGVSASTSAVGGDSSSTSAHSVATVVVLGASPKASSSPASANEASGVTSSPANVVDDASAVPPATPSALPQLKDAQLVAGVVGDALAASDQSLKAGLPTPLEEALGTGPCDQMLTRVNQALRVRQGSLKGWAVRLGVAGHLATNDLATLNGIVTTSQSGLTDIAALLNSDTCPNPLAEHARSIVTDFRIYELVHFQVHLSIAASNEVAGLVAVDQRVSLLQGAINAARGSGRSVERAELALADIRTQLASGSTTLSGVTARLLTLTPANVNDGSAAPAIDQIRGAIMSAREALAAISKDVETIAAALK